MFLQLKLVIFYRHVAVFYSYLVSLCVFSILNPLGGLANEMSSCTSQDIFHDFPI